MYEIFEELCKEKGVTPYKVSKETGISRSTLSDWKNGRSKPKGDKLQLIADYFGVSVETFTKNEEPRKPFNAVDLFAKPSADDLRKIFDTALNEALTGAYRLTDDEKKILMAYRITNENTKDIIRKILDVKKESSKSMTEAG